MSLTPRQQEQLRSEIADIIVEYLEPICDVRCRISVVIRGPHLPDGDLVVTNDDLDHVIAALQRLKTYPAIKAVS